MARNYPYPYPCDYHPRFPSQHEARVLVERFKEHGDMKDCTYLTVKGSGYMGYSYGPHCDRDSFRTEEDGHGKNLFYGCPKDCRLYEAAWKGRMKSRMGKAYRTFRGGVVGLSNWVLEVLRAIGGILNR